MYCQNNKFLYTEFNMEIILMKDIPRLGRKYEVKTVRDGYGRNFLLPQKFAVLKTALSLKNLESMKQANTVKRESAEKEIISSFEKLEGKEIIMREKANENGELFGSVSAQKISEKFKKEGFNIPEEYINLEHNIKHLGEYEIEVKTKDNSEKIKLKVEKE